MSGCHSFFSNGNKVIATNFDFLNMILFIICIGFESLLCFYDFWLFNLLLLNLQTDVLKATLATDAVIGSTVRFQHQCGKLVLDLVHFM
jgi:hypothetical protein